MVRSAFIKQLFGGFVLAVAGRNSIVSAGNSHTTLIYRHTLNGTYYYDAALVNSMMTTGYPLTLKREPHNPYDKNAISVYFREYKIGYIPRKDNSIFSRMLDINSDRFSAVLHEVKIYNGDYTDIVINIFENVNQAGN